MYNFIFDRRSLALLLGGLTIAGALVFFAGLLVGVNWIVPFPAARVASRPVPECPPATPAAALATVPAPAPAPAALPAEPMPEAEDPELAAEALEEPLPEEPAALEPEPLEVAPLPAPPRALRAARPVPAAITDAAGSFAVQVGAFSRPENSEAVVRDLESRGYVPYVLPLQGSTSRVLHTVRIGRFADREEAARAATDFRHKEKMAAIVLPADSL
jgi:cell division septation protein DedD